MKAYQMKIAINDSHPPIWRRFIVPAELSFSQLSIVLNEVMGWCGYHLFSFELDGIGLRLKEADEFDDDWELEEFDRDDSSEIMLEAYLDEEKHFTYVYDFGDDWRHSVVVEKIIEDYEHDYPMVLKFKGETPYEDCGGIYAYYDLLRILKDPSDPEYEEMKEWTDEHFTSKYVLEEVNSKLKAYKLTNKKSKPMRQKEIYDEIMRKGQGFKLIQGFKESVYKDYDGYDDYDDDDDDYDDLTDEDWEEFDNLLEEFEKNLKNSMFSHHWGKNLNKITLQDIYGDYTKEILVEMAKLHHIKGYSKYKKEELIEYLAQKVLEEDIMSRYFTFLDDEELAILEEKSSSSDEKEFWDEDIDASLNLVGGGYCGVSGMRGIVVPEEVKQRYKEIKTDEWEKARRQALELCSYLNGAADLYGICPVSQALAIYEKYTGKHIEEMALYSFCDLIPENKKNFNNHGMDLIHKYYDGENRIEELKRAQKGKPFYFPSQEEIVLLGTEEYLPFDGYMKDLCDYISVQLDMDRSDAEYFGAHIQGMFREGISVDVVLQGMEDNDMLYLPGQAMQMRKFLTAAYDHTRKRADRGNLPASTVAENKKTSQSTIPFNHPKKNIVEFPVDVKKKIYPNDPCPCGSGKKYKNCCGRNKK